MAKKNLKIQLSNSVGGGIKKKEYLIGGELKSRSNIQA